MYCRLRICFIQAQESQGKSQEILLSYNLFLPKARELLKVTFTHAKLPKLELKKFHGHPMRWYPIWETFESAVHKNTNLSSVTLHWHCAKFSRWLSAKSERQLTYLNKDSEIDRLVISLTTSKCSRWNRLAKLRNSIAFTAQCNLMFVDWKAWKYLSRCMVAS